MAVDKYALVAGRTMPGGELPRGRREVTVAVSAKLQRVAASMAAAAGLRATLVPEGAPSELILLSEGSTSATPARLSYNKVILTALLPGSDVLVGSLRYMMTDVTWLSDPGGMVVTVPSARKPVAVKASDDVDPLRDPYARATGPITISVNELPKPPLGVRGPMLRVALDTNRVRDVPLRNQDVVVDRAGARWHMRNGSLWSHKSVTLSREDVLMEGRTLRPARSGTPLVGVSVNDKVEVTLLGPQNVTVYGVVSDDDAQAWKIMMDVNVSIVSDPRATCFGARLAATAAECYAAGGVWDRPCETDVECPFYDSRTGRGGCLSGTCEMPLGVGNKSFRVADPATPALCEGGGNNPWCA